jgi:hypothetical protein
MLKQYPSTLPAAQKMDRAFQMVDPLVSSASSNGQTRWDRQFTDTPTATPVSWVFEDWQCALFRTWYKNTIHAGADWFEMQLKAPEGGELRECHFVQGYAGPERFGYGHWKITANLVLRRLPEIDPGWLDLPEFWDPRGRSIFDISLNSFWPLSPYDADRDAGVFDRAINEEWPEEVAP